MLNIIYRLYISLQAHTGVQNHGKQKIAKDRRFHFNSLTAKEMDEEKQARFGFGGQVATATQWYDNHRSRPT